MRADRGPTQPYRRPSAWLGLIAVSLSIGCAGSFVYEPRPYPPLKWNAGAVAFAIQDDRKSALPSVPEVPLVTFPGTGGGQDVKLPPGFVDFVRWRLARLVSGHGPNLKVVIVVERARAEWAASAFSETEHASASLRVRILSAQGETLLEGVGQASKEFSSGDASKQELTVVFRAACNDAFDAFFGVPGNLNQLNRISEKLMQR